MGFYSAKSNVFFPSCTRCSFENYAYFLGVYIYVYM